MEGRGGERQRGWERERKGQRGGEEEREGRVGKGGGRWNNDAVTMYVFTYLSRNIRTCTHTAKRKHGMYYSYMHTLVHTHIHMYMCACCVGLPALQPDLCGRMCSSILRIMTFD